MSTAYYNQRWQQVITELLSNVDDENCPLDENRNKKGVYDMNYKRTDLQWFQYYGGLYVRYLQSYRKLEDAYDQMIHPQKRILMREMLDNVVVRMCQVKQNLIRYSTQTQIIQSDYVNIDEILMDMKLTPKALRVPLPRYFQNQHSQRNQQIQSIIKDLGISEEEEVITNTAALESNLGNTVRIIQKLERGRQGILRGLQFAKAKSKQSKDRSQNAKNQEQNRAIVVQKFWRAFLSRKELHQIRDKQLQFLGIKRQPICKTQVLKAEKQRQYLNIIQKNRQERFQADKENIKENIKKNQEPIIKATMLDERRKWIHKFLQMHEFANLPINVDQFYKQPEVSIQNPIKDNKKNSDTKKDQSKTKGKKNDLDKFLDDHLPIGPTNSVINMQQNIKSYTKTWGTRDQTEISEQLYDSDILSQELRPEVCIELQRLVDGIINLELDNMRVKYGIKKKKEKKKKPKKKKQKKVKIPQGLSKLEPEELLQELFQKNIAKILAPAQLQHFIGQHNPVTHIVEKNSSLIPDPSLFQVRNIAAEYIGLPLGCQIAKNKLEKWNWFLFYGPSGTGKTMIIRALHKQTNSLVFDLTPEYVKQNYSEKSQLIRLIWSVIICAKHYQPSIIMIDDFETIFPGVKPKKKDQTVSFGLKMKKIITDMKKNKLWTKNDRIAVIGCTNRPYEGSVREMKKIFDKKLYFPYPNYPTRKLMMQTMLQVKTERRIDNFPFETFAHISQGFTAGSFKHCVDKVVTPLRLQRIKDEPLKLSEFVDPLSSSICVFADEYQKMRRFTDEVTGLRERRQKSQVVGQDDKKQKKKSKKQ